MNEGPTETVQAAPPVKPRGSWAAKDQRPLCPRGSDGRRRHCMHHHKDDGIWVCCTCIHERTDEQAADPNWREG